MCHRIAPHLLSFLLLWQNSDQKTLRGRKSSFHLILEGPSLREVSARTQGRNLKAGLPDIPRSSTTQGPSHTTPNTSSYLACMGSLHTLSMGSHWSHILYLQQEGSSSLLCPLTSTYVPSICTCTLMHTLKDTCKKKWDNSQAWEKAQHLRALALAKDPGSARSTHMAASNCNSSTQRARPLLASEGT